MVEFFAVISRLTQGMFLPDELRCNACVDDPALVVGGDLQQRIMALVILTWAESEEQPSIG